MLISDGLVHVCGRSQQAQWQAVWEGSNQSERKGQEADAALLTMKSPLQATALRRVRTPSLRHRPYYWHFV
jgi:hypothetical protein